MNPITGVTVTGLGVLAIGLFDTIYNWRTCYSVLNNPLSGVILNFQADMGLSPYSKELRHNISLQNDSTLEYKEVIEGTHICHPLPLLPIFFLGAIILEIIKLVVLVIRKRKTVPAPSPVPVPSSSSNPVPVFALASNSKTTYVNPVTSTQNNDLDMQLTSAAISNVTSTHSLPTSLSGIHQSSIYRAQSLPDIYNPPAVTLRRRNSLEIKETRTLPLPIKSQVLKAKPVQAIVMKQPILVKQNITFEHVRNVTKDLCIRTSSLSTVMAFLCFGLTAYIVLAERRFSQYCIIVILSSLDKDLVEFYMKKF